MNQPKRDTDIEQAFLAVYDTHADALFRYCWRRVYDREKGRDVMQEAFMKTWEYLAQGHQVDNIKAFVYKTIVVGFVKTPKVDK